MSKEKCLFDPKAYLGEPIGAFNCPLCGDEKYDEFKRYLESHLNKNTYDTFIFFIETHKSVKHHLMEIWFRCDINEEQRCMYCNRDVPGPFLYCSELCTKAHAFEMSQEPQL